MMNDTRKFDIYDTISWMSPKDPAYCRAQLIAAHSALLSQVCRTYYVEDINHGAIRKIVTILNSISYMYLCGDTIPSKWNATDPLNTWIEYDEEEVKTCLDKYDMYVYSRYVSFDRLRRALPNRSEDSISTAEASAPVKSSVSSVPQVEFRTLTDKSDLYIQCPAVPQFDSASIWAAGQIDGTSYTVYRSYPLIPTKQNEISATTDLAQMRDSDLLRLFPNQFIPTRAPVMYTPCDGIELHPVLGLLIPIQGFSREDIIANIIQYPHLFKLLKYSDTAVPTSFYTTIEVNGTLYNVTDIWRDLSDSKRIPYNKDFIKEYVVRRYLLERDVLHMEHRYSMYGTLDPFLTLFTSVEGYADLGYTDPIELSKKCVASRISYKRSRNPVLRRLSDE